MLEYRARQKTLGRHVCDKLLVAHGLLGCDATSRLYSIGKSAALKKLNSSAYLSGLLATFNTPGASKEDVITAGENALVCLYNGQPRGNTGHTEASTLLPEGFNKHCQS